MQYSGWGFDGITTLQRGFPVKISWGGGIQAWKNGEVVGAVAVSGLLSNEDIALATLGADLIAGL
jgi:uncharacterized protein GlcG (DUF336 family)